MQVEQYCYLTTTGRRTGNAHTIEIWFATDPEKPTVLYMLAGGGEDADWVRNIRHSNKVRVKIGTTAYTGQGRVVDDAGEEKLARRLVVAKYYGRQQVRDTGWEAEALPLAIELEV